MTYEEPAQVTIPDDGFPVGGENEAVTEDEHEEHEPEEA